MRQRKRLTLPAVLLVLIMLCGLGACQNERKVTELRFIGYNPQSARAAYLRYLEEKLPHIKITYEYVAVDEFSSSLESQLKAGKGPDIIEVGGETKQLAVAGFLLDLTEQAFVRKYVHSGLSAFVANNKVFATPLQSWYEGIYYNKRIFAENGVSIPYSLDEFIGIHKVLAGKGIKPQAMGAQSWEPMMKQSIGVVNNEFYSDPANRGFDEEFNQGKAFLADAWLDAVKAWSRVIDEGCLTKDMLEVTYEQALSEFALGEAAMWESGPWSIQDILDINPAINEDLGMFPIPGLSRGVGWLVGGPGSALAINAKTKRVKQALEVLELTATPEAQEALIIDNAGSSFLIGVRADLGDIYSDCEQAFQAGNVYAPWMAVWDYGNFIVEEYGKSLQEVLAGSKTVEQALNDADAANQMMLKR